MGLVEYAKLRVVDNEAMENIRVIDQRYWSLIIGILTASTKCNVFRYVKVLLQSNNYKSRFYWKDVLPVGTRMKSVPFSFRELQYQAYN